MISLYQDKNGTALYAPMCGVADQIIRQFKNKICSNLMKLTKEYAFMIKWSLYIYLYVQKCGSFKSESDVILTRSEFPCCSTCMCTVYFGGR